MASAGRILMFPVGNWILGNDYGILDIVYHEGSSYIAKNNIINSTTPPPDDPTNWQIHARGFGADALSEISAEDTSGVLGTTGAVVASQDLLDAIADKVMTKLIPYTNIANNFLATDPKTVLSGPMGKSLKDQLDTTNSNLTLVSNDITTLSNDLNTQKGTFVVGSGWGAMQAGASGALYRLQLQANGNLDLYKSTNGTTWTKKTIATASDL